MNKLNFHFILLCTLLFLLYFQSHTLAQSFLIKDVPQENLSIDLRFIHPFYKTPNKLSIISGVYDLNFSIPISDKWNINMAAPVVVFNNEANSQNYFYYSNEYNKTALGNIYLGLQSRDSTSTKNVRNFSFGVFLPTADKNKYGNVNFFGLLTNYFDLQKYFPETVSLYSNIAFRWYLENGVSFGLDVGPQYLINTSDKVIGGNNFLLHYGLSSGIRLDDFILKSEFTGILMLTGHGQDFSDRFINFLSLGLSYTNFVVKPSIFYQFNFHELYTDLSAGSLGLKFSYVME